MSTMTTKHETEISVDEKVPLVRIVREFDAPPHRVYRAHVDPDLVVQWLGPHRLSMRLEEHDIRRGGSYRYVHIDEDGTEYGFWGAVHDARPGELIIQTFGFDGAPDTPSFDKMTLEELPGGRTRVTGLSVVDSLEIRDQMIASGMEVGVDEGYEKLDDLLAGS